MSERRGIIAGLRRLFRWSDKYPNGRLAVLALVVFLIPQFLIRTIESGLQSSVFESMSLPMKRSILTPISYVVGIMPIASVAVECVLITFSGWRAYRDFRDRHAATSAASTLRAPPD